jgi:transcription initiation factor TFIIA small subunit
MNYELYRRSTLGITLTDALDELIQSEQITPQLAMRILAQFDKSVSDALENRIKTRATIKGHLKTYRFCDDVWTFILGKCQIRVYDQTIQVEKAKIVACNAKKPGVESSQPSISPLPISGDHSNTGIGMHSIMNDPEHIARHQRLPIRNPAQRQEALTALHGSTRPPQPHSQY